MKKYSIVSLISVVVLAGVAFLFAGSTTFAKNSRLNMEAPLGYIAGDVVIGPFCSVFTIDQDCTYLPASDGSRSIVVYANDGVTVVATGIIDVNGHYIVAVPGSASYFVEVVPEDNFLVIKKPVRVRPLHTSIINFVIDPGMR